MPTISVFGCGSGYTDAKLHLVQASSSNSGEILDSGERFDSGERSIGIGVECQLFDFWASLSVGMPSPLASEMREAVGCERWVVRLRAYPPLVVVARNQRGSGVQSKKGKFVHGLKILMIDFVIQGGCPGMHRQI